MPSLPTSAHVVRTANGRKCLRRQTPICLMHADLPKVQGESGVTTKIGKAAYKRIATEEAWLMKDIFDRYMKLVETKALKDPAFESLWSYYGTSPSPRSVATLRRILSLGEERIADMDASGIDVQLLMHTAPGVQVFDAPEANSLAAASNDMVAEAIRNNPGRYAALAMIAPQDPQTAAKEMERGVKKLGLKGAVINSHTRGEFLNDQKFWPIFEAAEALNVPVYVHPSGPPVDMAKPFIERGLDGAIYGFAVECGLHLLTIITSGVFDRFPKLQVVFGHLGEGMPFWIPRLDYMHAAYPHLPLWAAGFSFGAWIALEAGAVDDRVSALIGIAPPVSRQGYSFPHVLASTKPKFFVQGGLDEICPTKDMRAFYSRLHEPKELVEIDGASHLFDGRTGEVGEALEDLLGDFEA